MLRFFWLVASCVALCGCLGGPQPEPPTGTPDAGIVVYSDGGAGVSDAGWIPWSDGGAGIDAGPQAPVLPPLPLPDIDVGQTFDTPPGLGGGLAEPADDGE